MFSKYLISIIAYAQFFGMVVVPVLLSLVGPMSSHDAVATKVHPVKQIEPAPVEEP